MAISGALCVAIGLAALGLVPARVLAESSSPLARTISSLGNPALVYVMSLGALFATAGVLLTAILGVSRMASATARDGDLPATLNRLHPRYGTPHIAIVLVGLLTIVLVFTGNLARVVPPRALVIGVFSLAVGLLYWLFRRGMETRRVAFKGSGFESCRVCHALGYGICYVSPEVTPIIDFSPPPGLPRLTRWDGKGGASRQLKASAALSGRARRGQFTTAGGE